MVWITGSSAGIGRAIAFELAKAGCKLVLSGTKVDRLHSVKKECLGKFFSTPFFCSSSVTNFPCVFVAVINSQLDDKDILIVPFNMTDFEEHPNSFDKILKHFGRLDILVNNAGRLRLFQGSKI